MHTNDLIALFSELQKEQDVYRSWGYAVIAHGHIRTTLDLDIVVDFTKAEVLFEHWADIAHVSRALSDLGDALKRTNGLKRRSPSFHRG